MSELQPDGRLPGTQGMGVGYAGPCRACLGMLILF